MGSSLPAEAIAHQQHPLARWRRVSAISATSPPPSIFSFFVYFFIFPFLRMLKHYKFLPQQ